jgi:hypothetical protein
MAVRPPRAKDPALKAKLKDLNDRVPSKKQENAGLEHEKRPGLAKQGDKKSQRSPKSGSDKTRRHAAEEQSAQENGPTQTPKIAKQEHGVTQTPPQKNQAQRPAAPVFSVSRLAAEQNVDMARTRGFQQTPDVNDYLLAKQEVSTGQGLAETLHRAHEPSPDTDGDGAIAPEEFLSAFESMKDIFIKIHGRASPKTTQLLEGPDLEDMIQMLQELHMADELRRSSEARIKNSIFGVLKDEPGPLLLGLNDPRLLEPWRLFLDGWDIWVPEVESDLEDAESSGVEIFWEGEAEDRAGREIQITQTLGFEANRVKLSTQFGDDNDELSFDGMSFYRLKKR